MILDGYGFYFEKAGRSAAQGAIAPAEQFFEGSVAEMSVARELGQNSLDAARGDGPVLMQFELRQMETEDIPGIAGLVEHLESVVDATRGASGNERMRRALSLAQQDHLWVLRVGDYGTTGLIGNENDTNSPLAALTRGEGISANDGTRGGSFGIGSAVGPMASDLSTVMYTSMSDDRLGEVVFAAQSRLATHSDQEGVTRRAEGYFTLLSDGECFRYLRDPGPIGPFAPRVEPGTDIFLLGYRKAEDDPRLIHIRDAFVRNFMLAIHRGTLVVEGHTPEGSWVLNSSTLPDFLDDETRAFYRAMHDPEPYVKDVAGLGLLRLFVEIDDTLPKKLHTITVRTPLMKISTYRHTSVPVKYAAILDCSNPVANSKLRDLEPPQHDRWDPGRSAEGPALDRRLKEFVKQGLASKVTEQVGKQVEIKGLARLLPAELWNGESSSPTGSSKSASGDGTASESATVHGDPEAFQNPELNKERRSVTVSVRKPGIAGDGQPAEKGRDTGGGGTRKNDKPGIPGEAREGDGRSRIPARAVKLRSWSDGETGDLMLSIRATELVVGDLRLVALGPGGSSEDDYLLPIVRATLQGDEPSEVHFRENTLQDLTLSPETSPALIRVEFNRPHRYLLGVI